MHKILLSIVFVSLLTVEFLPFLVHPGGYCALPAVSDDAKKQLALGFLEHVVQVNLTNYKIGYAYAYTPQIQPNPPDNWTFAEIRLLRNNSKLDFEIQYVNGRFFWYSFLDSRTARPAGAYNDYLLAAIHAVGGYNYLFNPTYGQEMHDMISTALQNRSSIVENDITLLKVSYGGEIQIEWFKKTMGYVSELQRFSMTISEKGFLTFCMDTLSLYHVATTTINVSKQEALNASTRIIEDYANQHEQKIVSTNVTFSWTRDSTRQRGNDDYAVYPAWSVKATFDKTNEEHVCGYDVNVWADNGQVAWGSEEGLRGAPESIDSTYDNSNLLLTLTTIATVLAFICVGMYLRHRNKTR
jgi:hypothetical protein